MGRLKRKVISFDEADLEWINPLINDWEKENEGKKQGDLIVQLLREFTLQRESISIEDESETEFVTPIEKDKQHYFGRAREVLSINLDEFGSGARMLQDRLQDGYEKLKGDIGKSTQALSNRFNKLESRVRGLISRPHEEAGEARVEALEAKVEKLQTMVNELKAKLAGHDEDEEDRFDEAAALATEMEELLAHEQAPAR